MDDRKLQKQGRVDGKRRRVTAGLFLGLVGSLAGCGGSDDEGLSNGSAIGGSSTSPWEVAPARSLVLAPGTSFNLAATLPTNVPGGGVFEVDASGSPLPPGITLSRGGLLSVSSGATGGTAGVVFRYTPPA